MYLPPDLFITNKAPDDEELFKAREAIKAANTRLETVQKMITEQEEENKLLKKIEAYQNIASPLRRVPDDVLEILLACTDGLPKVDINVAPLLFLRISQRIRQLALNLPRLWAGITIDTRRITRKKGPFGFDTVASRLAKSYLDLISQWLLVRSAAMPLKIRVPNEIRDNPHADEHGLLAILFQCKSRWHSITIYLHGDKPIAQLIAQVNDTEQVSRNLRDLTVRLYRYNTSFDNISGDGLLLSPNLTRLTLISSYRPIIMLNPASLNWTKLTALEISGSANTLGPVLHQASSITFLALIAASESAGTVAYTAGIIHFPYLTSLHIVDHHESRISLHIMQALMDIVDPPFLKELRLKRSNWSFLDEQCLSSLLSRISCLESLTTPAVKLEIMPRILGRTPMLKELRNTDRTSYNRQIQNAFLDALDNGHVCPHLHILEYEKLFHADNETVDRFRRLREDLSQKKRVNRALREWAFKNELRQ